VGTAVSFRKLLIANRGEIACRVIRTARRLGYRTVAVYSQADAGALHVQQADEAVAIGGAAPAESYLNIPALLQAAQRTGADAVHPGYGFLSERADFAEACAAAGLVFVGPPAEAIRAMGDKAGAKRRMQAVGVPCARGYLGEDQSDQTLAEQAALLGTPLLVKAVAGGGGRGMRLVRDLAELPAALAGARREALGAFGDDRLMLERLVDQARHIEIQVFADAHGHVVHLGERDCTAQRRRQKVIEESPALTLSPQARQAMARDAVAAARAVGYRGAGTVEFIVDAAGQHHFLEMNTRLQVEHPVTECVTGLDLVEWQLRVAAGEPLPLTQEQIRFSGHAIEVRLVAEDPCDGWKPQTGRTLAWQPDEAGVRVDHGLQAHDEVTPWYDAMVAKFIAHGQDREDAIRRLMLALARSPLLGVQNNGGFLRRLLDSPDFRAHRLVTTSLDEWAKQGHALVQRPAVPEAAWRIAAALRAPPAWRPASLQQFDLRLACHGEQRSLRAPPDGVVVHHWAQGRASISVDGVLQAVHALQDGSTLHLALEGDAFVFTEPTPWPTADAKADASRARAGVAGVVAQLAVQVGDRVDAGQPLVCVEAMKMEMWLHAAAPGTVRAVNVRLKDSVAAGAVLVELELQP
jgi:geranyl-CoA carboxylase alpha subunit